MTDSPAPSHAPTDPTAPEGSDELLGLIGRASRIVAFTGAGISTESGVPDFRTPGSPWMANKPIPYDEFVRSEGARREAWRRKFTMDDLYRGARPSRGHRALAALVREGRSPGIVTQNIDALHQAAGLPDEAVVELHGNGTYAVCIACDRRHELAAIRAAFEATGEAPRCESCDGPVKSATVSFGQPMPPDAMRRARDLSLACDLFLCVGSSLVVQPAASFPVIAKRNGARLVILNREPTGLDPIADLVVQGEIGPALAPLARPA